MPTELEVAFRSVLKSVVREVLLEFASDRRMAAASEFQRQQHNQESLLLTIREAAKRLAISERHLFQLTKTGILPCVRVGGSVRYSVEAILEWIRRTQSTGPITEAESENPEMATSEQLSARKRTRSVLARREPVEKKRLKQEATPTTQRTRPVTKARQTPEKTEEFHDPVSDLLKEIGVSRSDLPPLSNGLLMGIAEVDLPTFHGWRYLKREMPEEALNKLRSHFQAYRKKEAVDESEKR